jgi:hypothetical protein
METQALIFMVTSEVIITGLTLYFFIRVLYTKPKGGEDSYTDNEA